MSIRRLTAVLALTSLLSLGSCSYLKDNVLGPSQEEPVDPTQTYHNSTSEGTQLRLGPDQEKLLSAFSKLQKEKVELRSRLERVETQNTQLRARLDSTEKDRSEVQRQKAVTEADLQRLRKELARREAEYLALSIEKAKRDHEFYALKVALLKDQLDAVTASSSDAKQSPTLNAHGMRGNKLRDH